MKYLISVSMGILSALLLVLLMPIFAIIMLIAGFLGLVKVNEEKQNG